MSTLPDAKIIDRVRKLLALANNNPNEHEAATAAAQAAELMARHRVDLALVEGPAVAQEPIETAEPFHACAGDFLPDWESYLLNAVADALACAPYVVTKRVAVERADRSWVRRRHIGFIGRATDCAAAAALFAYVHRQIVAICEREVAVWRNRGMMTGSGARRPPTSGETQKWKFAFKTGCSSRVADRILIASAKAQQSALQLAAGHDHASASRALVRIDQHRAAVSAFAETALAKRKSGGRDTEFDADGLRAGRRAGDEVDIERRDPTKTLGDGRPAGQLTS